MIKEKRISSDSLTRILIASEDKIGNRDNDDVINFHLWPKRSFDKEVSITHSRFSRAVIISKKDAIILANKILEWAKED